MDIDRSVDFLKALAHPLRLKISLGLCHKKECHVSQMVERLGVPQATISHQLSILRRAGVVQYHKKGANACYYISNDDVRSFLNCLRSKLDIDEEIKELESQLN